MLEGFEDVVRLFFEARDYIVSGSVSIPFEGLPAIKRQERLNASVGPSDPAIQIDLVAARADRLVICEVKSWFKSTGLVFDRHFADGSSGSQIRLFNDEAYRAYVAKKLAEKFGYKIEQLNFCLVAGKTQPSSLAKVREHFEKQNWLFYTSDDIAKPVLARARQGHYVNDTAVAMIRCLEAADLLKNEES